MALQFGTPEQKKVTEVMEAARRKRGEVEQSIPEETEEELYIYPEKVTVAGRVSPDVKKRLQKEAYRHGMRMSAYLDYFLNEHLPKD